MADASRNDTQHLIPDVSSVESHRIKTSPRPAFSRSLKIWTWLLTDSWALECFASFVAIAALTSIATILGLYHEHALSDWKYFITLNTLLSLLATTLKGAVLLPVSSCIGQLKWIWYHQKQRKLNTIQAFDSASRGPMGAARLFFILRPQLASIGCLVTLITLFSDAFVQQSVQYPSRQANSTNGTATVPISQYYDQHGKIASLDVAIDPSMLAAVYEGAFSANLSKISTSLSPQCSTGNCTFPAYASLAMCSECRDVSALVKTTNQATYNRTFLPNGLSLDLTDSLGILNMSTDIALNTNDFDGNPLVSLSMMYMDVNVDTDGDGYSSYNYGQTVAYDCIFSICAEVFHAAVSDGIFTESVTKTYYLSVQSSDTLDNWEFQSSLNISQDQLPTESNLTFAISEAAADGILTWLNANMNGTGLLEDENTYTWSSDFLRAIFENGAERYTEVIANIATTMTTNIRLQSGQQVQGFAISMESFIRVRWLWLILPLIMAVLTVAMLALTMWQSHHLGISSWRNSILAVIKTGLQDDWAIFENMGEAQHDHANALEKGILESKGEATISALEKWASELDVRLGQGSHKSALYEMMRVEYHRE
ncbi:hypothetical protein MMC32_002108 [Xylographa parallela]|nr:hypothetical protein [Xylographa parallela]